ncbi:MULTISPECIES: hypothetical protein [unclassified Campylobacter]|uniref:hypothetical protein n=1 Tax=unclassified Campylobacter TaxID=2593542 RepID=UPI0012381C4B|nr:MULTISPECIES: hypothetical protein [unclassified Campylobacter]KAA6226486.1 hypothetical protein FMM54_04405 [Campylobacter sp. LR185c]KAA6228621.1 hypothetical protein FMM55_00965 [Campylobacter sp. LR196d]KAA6229174.1 hypothetical protein FMM57_01250 [Campylobacter sp. LR286c]KAA6233965.1 hypothetical protein FMM58_01380 [Campylobacter sp. LR291e]KAA6234204.1 hypothetical protein FMM56_01305 [Campylobacter sp. LR264d]
MAFKENLEAVKSGLNTEEQFIEKFIKGERFIKKYKFYILAILIILVLYFITTLIIQKVQESNIQTSNELYASLMQNSNDSTTIKLLKDKNINLYAIFLAQNLDSNLEELKTLTKNEKLNPLLKNILVLNFNENSIFLKDFSTILQAFKLLEENKIKEANILLNKIKPNSSLEQLSQNLKHYQGI